MAQPSSVIPAPLLRVVPNDVSTRGPTKGDRIAIIGAGAGGIAAAYYLKKAGYTSVTVFERENRVGGKCSTIHHEGRSFELGAGVISPKYTHVRALMREHGIESTPSASGFFVDLDRGATSYMVPSPEKRKWLAFAREMPRWLGEIRGETRLWTPGFDGLEGEMALPFETWAKRRGYAEIVELIRPWFTAFGYGFLSEIPAAYVLKYLTIWGFPLSELRTVGFQGLWERVARDLDVRCGVDVRRVARDASGVTIETAEDTMRFDRLVLACPLDRALGFLDATREERHLFSQIEYVDYRVVVATVLGMPARKWTFCADHLAPENAGAPMFWYRRWPERPLHTFYTIAAGNAPDVAIVREVESMVCRLGGRVSNVHRVVRWNYFPHVDTNAMANGYYRRIESLQGQRRTHYAGELLSFPTVETVTAYSADLVQRFFDARMLARAGA